MRSPSDYRLLLTSRLVRGFGFGFAAVLIGIHLERRGLRPEQIGISLSAALLAGAVVGLILASLSRRIGRRGALMLSGGLMAITGLDLALGPGGLLLVLAGATGMLGAASVDVGPYLGVEQAMLAEATPSQHRNRTFARYSLTGGVAAAVGALAAGLGTSLAATTVFFLAYAAIGAGTAVLALGLSRRVETSASQATPGRASLRPVAGLAALFALDSLGGGLVVQSVIVYWLHVRFGAGSQILGPAFTLITLLQAASFEVAGRLADRIGLVRTMVFTHLPSNLLLVLVPLAPSLGWAVALLALRFSISQMDVPARQAYIVSMVPARDRAQAVALTNGVRGAVQAVGPALAGIAIQSSAFGLPFFVAGGLKVTYDLGLYAAFRNRPAEHEARPAQGPAS